MAFDKDVTREVERERIVDVEAYKNRPLPGQVDMLDKQDDDVDVVVVVVESAPQPEPSIVVVESVQQPEPVIVVQESEPAPAAEPVVIVVREELDLPFIPPDPPEPKRKQKSKEQIIRDATRRAVRETTPSTKRKPAKNKSKGAKRRAHPFLTRAESRRR